MGPLTMSHHLTRSDQQNRQITNSHGREFLEASLSVVLTKASGEEPQSERCKDREECLILQRAVGNPLPSHQQIELITQLPQLRMQWAITCIKSDRCATAKTLKSARRTEEQYNHTFCELKLAAVRKPRQIGDPSSRDGSYFEAL